MPTQWQVSDGKALCPKKTLRLLSLCFLPPSSSSCLCKKHSPQASVSFLRKQKETAPSLSCDFNFIHAYSNLTKKRHSQTLPPCYWVSDGLAFRSHLVDATGSQMSAPFITRVYLSLSVTVLSTMVSLG